MWTRCPSTLSTFSWSTWACRRTWEFLGSFAHPHFRCGLIAHQDLVENCPTLQSGTYWHTILQCTKLNLWYSYGFSFYMDMLCYTEHCDLSLLPVHRDGMELYTCDLQNILYWWVAFDEWCLLQYYYYYKCMFLYVVYVTQQLTLANVTHAVLISDRTFASYDC
jgi:hypothetical protein